MQKEKNVPSLFTHGNTAIRFYGKTLPYSPHPVSGTRKRSNVYTQTRQAATPSISLIAPTLAYMLVLPRTYRNPAPSIRFSGTTILLGGLLSDWQSDVTPLSTTTFNAGTKYHYEVKYRWAVRPEQRTNRKNSRNPAAPLQNKNAARSIKALLQQNKISPVLIY